MNLLNLGCGTHFHPDCINVDFVSHHKEVISHNLLKGIPFANESFDAVYHSHLLEHIPREKVENFIRECHRILKYGGIIRIAVPNLEKIVKAYLQSLKDAIEHKNNAELKYDWMMLELYDQTVRNYSGGIMGEYIAQGINSDDFVKNRIGPEAAEYEKNIKAKHRFLVNRLKAVTIKNISRKARILLSKSILYLLGGAEFKEYFKTGLFRHSGEIHYWMYDRYSLTRLLKNNGFSEIKICEAHESRIPGFNCFGLDVVNGIVRKPDSLFMEAVK